MANLSELTCGAPGERTILLLKLSLTGVTPVETGN